jgi:hypothetical protein
LQVLFPDVSVVRALVLGGDLADLIRGRGILFPGVVRDLLAGFQSVEDLFVFGEGQANRIGDLLARRLLARDGSQPDPGILCLACLFAIMA